MQHFKNITLRLFFFFKHCHPCLQLLIGKETIYVCACVVVPDEFELKVWEPSCLNESHNCECTVTDKWNVNTRLQCKAPFASNNLRPWLAPLVIYSRKMVVTAPYNNVAFNTKISLLHTLFNTRVHIDIKKKEFTNIRITWLYLATHICVRYIEVSLLGLTKIIQAEVMLIYMYY